MFNEAFDRPILACGITALEYDKHLMLMPDDVVLNLDELDLELVEHSFVLAAAPWYEGASRGFRH
jgi:hypothetical protein